MTIFTRVTVVAIATLLCARPALGERKEKQATPKVEAGKEADGCESTGLSTKRCSISGDSAELHLRISNAHPVIVTLDELPSFTYNDPYIAHQVTEQFVLFKLRKDKLPKGHNLILRTESMTITLFFTVVSSGGDSQVHIERSDRAGQNRVVEARVAERTAALEREHAKALEGLEARAKSLARKQFLNQVFMDGSQVGKPAGAVRNRNDFLVLRATDTIRIGKERLLQISIEERKGAIFTIGSLSASLEQRGTKRTLDVDFRCERMVIRPGKTVRCTVSLGEIDKRSGRALISVRVDGADGQRSVGLDSVDIL